jgi:hypothetical protein
VPLPTGYRLAGRCVCPEPQERGERDGGANPFAPALAPCRTCLISAHMANRLRVCVTCSDALSSSVMFSLSCGAARGGGVESIARMEAAHTPVQHRTSLPASDSHGPQQVCVSTSSGESQHRGTT